MPKKKYFYKNNKKEKVPLIMPEHGKDNKKVIKYLTKTRCIDEELVNHLIDDGYIYQDNRNNCVFLGFTGKKKLRHISLRSMDSKGKVKIDVPGSDKQFSFSLRGSSNTVNVFESTKDLLSFMSLFKNEEGIMEDGFVALGGIGRQALKRYLGENRYIEKIRICTDNDDAGNQAVELIKKEFGEKYKIVRRKPHHKDFNEDLIYVREKHIRIKCK